MRKHSRGASTNYHLVEYMNIVQVFGESEVRFVKHPENKFDFGIVAADIAIILNAEPDGSKIARSVDDDWKGTLSMGTPGGTQLVTVIWEPGIYQLLAKSRKPQAKPFQKWLFEEVVPAIRKTGKYERKTKKAIEQKSPEWIATRQQGKDERRKLTDAIKDYLDRHPELSDNKRKFMYSNASESLNLGIFAKRSKQLKALLGLSSNALLRDGLTSQENSSLGALEFLVCRLIDHEDLDPCLAVKKAIEMSYSHRMFAEKYLNQETLPAGEN